MAAPVKAISKKEQKRREQEEFDRMMNELGIEGSAAAATQPEESKQAAVGEEQAAIDEKKRLANQKKKEKRKAKAAAAKAEQTEASAEMTEEQRAEAIQEAIRKRQAKAT